MALIKKIWEQQGPKKIQTRAIRAVVKKILEQQGPQIN